MFFFFNSLSDKNGWQHYVYQADEYALHGAYVRATKGIELYLAKRFCHHNIGVQVAVNAYLERHLISSVASYLIYYTSKTILKTQGTIHPSTTNFLII